MSNLIIPGSASRIGSLLDVRAEQLRQKREAKRADVGTNFANSIADVSIEFPEDQLRILRDVSPITNTHSWLLPYWYRAQGRWVLYDALPVNLIPADDTPVTPMLTGEQFFMVMNGVRPSEREDFKDLVVWPVSDVQHEMYRIHRVFARPFWVLQGPYGGHQVHFSPQQAAHLVSMGLPDAPPKIGALDSCPFDNRAAAQLRHLNRLHQMEDSIEALRKSSSREWAEAEQARVDREIREAEMRFVEQQMTPIVDMATSLVRGSKTRSEHRDQIVDVLPGTASRAKDAYERYRQTGDYDPTLKDFTGNTR